MGLRLHASLPRHTLELIGGHDEAEALELHALVHALPFLVALLEFVVRPSQLSEQIAMILVVDLLLRHTLVARLILLVLVDEHGEEAVALYVRGERVKAACRIAVLWLMRRGIATGSPPHLVVMMSSNLMRLPATILVGWVAVATISGVLRLGLLPILARVCF